MIGPMNEAQQRRKRLTLNKLGQVCQQLEAILAGQDMTLKDVILPQNQSPGETPLERLERFKALLNETLGELQAGQPRVCQGCQAPLPDPVVDEMPWAFACQSCAADLVAR